MLRGKVHYIKTRYGQVRSFPISKIINYENSNMGLILFCKYLKGLYIDFISHFENEELHCILNCRRLLENYLFSILTEERSKLHTNECGSL